MAKSKTSRATYDFGGPIGAAAIVFGLPLLLYWFYFTCNDIYGCPAPVLLRLRTLSFSTLKSQIPWPHNGWRGFVTWEVTAWVLAYYLLSLLLYRLLPAQEVYGTKLRESERPLKYRFNAFYSTLAQLAACAVGTHLHGSSFVLWTFINENYLQILTANILLAYLLALFVYIRSFEVKAGNRDMRELARGGCTGNLVYDFFIGRELNPRITLPFIGEVDIKAWMEMRPGLTGWLLLDLAFVAKQHARYGRLSDSILVTALAQGYYVLEGQYAEAGLLGMMDITTDGLGFMLSFGDIVWVPFLYSTQCRYLSVHPVQLGRTGLVVVGLVFAAGLYIFRAANTQKKVFRRNPHDASVASLSSMPTTRGTRLLTDGWWGAARHVNYFGDWLQAVPFSLPTGIAGYMILPAGSAADAVKMMDGRELVPGVARGWGMLYTYFYVVYFASLLIHRERRDHAACADKYGEDWDKYTKIVKWRIVPGLY
ncbi:hypothetical protein RJ55_04245 [Drechmeria coniospora]|nr:hypothetical protein RJ55_04245 [Drechmeria coniospora]